MHTEIPQPSGAFLIRWRYTTHPVCEGRRVDLAHRSVPYARHPLPGSASLKPTGAWQLRSEAGRRILRRGRRELVRVTPKNPDRGNHAINARSQRYSR